jgi:adhesin transport system outer membrane protein
VKRFLLAGSALLLASQPAFALSLKEAIQMALSEHPRVGIAQENLRASEYRLDAANSELLPKVDIDADVGKQYVDRPGSLSKANNARWWLRQQATVTGSLVLFDGMQRANAIYRDAAHVDAASLQVVAQSEALALSVIEAYIDYRRHKYLLKIADDNINYHWNILKLARERLAGGKGLQSDVDQVQERLFGAQAARAEIKLASYETDAKFKEAVGVEPGVTEPVNYPSGIPASKQAAVDLANAKNPTLAASDAEAEAFGFEYERTKSELFPTLSLEGSAQVGHDLDAVPGRNDDYGVKLRLTWQIYDGGLRTARIGEASANAAEARLKHDLQLREITKSVEATYGRLLASKERLDAINEQVAAAERVAASYKKEYEASRRSLLDLLDAQRAVFTSRFQQASISGVRLFTAYMVKAETGTLLSSMGLSAPAADVDYGNVFLPSSFNKPLQIEPLR